MTNIKLILKKQNINFFSNYTKIWDIKAIKDLKIQKKYK